MKNYESMTDEMLALQYVGGDNRAFDELLTRNQKKLYDYIMFVVRDPELANDVFQETFQGHHQIAGRQVHRFRQVLVLADSHST